MPTSGGLPEYPDCPKVRHPPSQDEDKEIAEKVTKGATCAVLPLFEKTIYEHKYRKYYSLETNEFLHCRHRSYVQAYGDREKAPFTFVDIRDIHFYNGLISLLPSESIHRNRDYRFKLKVGPGVDFRGQMPIPQELHMKRGFQKPKRKPKVYPKSDAEDQSQNKMKQKS